MKNYEKNSLLTQGISILSEEFPEIAILLQEKQYQLIQYLDLLEKWNKTYNLSAIRERDEMEVKHILDSLAIVPYLQQYLIEQQSLADIGTGAGLPGIILGILYPKTAIYLVECVGKKTAFLQQVKLELKLENVHVHHQRIQDFKQPVQHLMSRAFCRLADFHSWTQHLHHKDTIIWAMKAKFDVVEDEFKELSQPDYIKNIIPLNVPFLDEERCLVKMTHQS